MKVRHTHPAGQVSASKIKALLLCLEEAKGADVAEAWLAQVRVARADLEDETHLLPLVLFRDALRAFVEVLPDGVPSAARYLIAPENLGAWARVLRVARAPEQAFTRIDSTESEYGRTTRWEMLAGGPGWWRGRVRIVHDPALESDGLLARARANDLAVVPALFGFALADVRALSPSVSPPAETQEFEVRWQLPSPRRSALVGGVVGAAMGGAVVAAHPTPLAALSACALPVVGALAGLARSRGASTTIDAAAQGVRVAALERSLMLREGVGRDAAGGLEGTVVAGQFRVGRRMGSGASGVIYEATRISDGLRVAVKLLRAASAHDGAASDRLRRESEALGLSWHPNVVELVDYGQLQDGTSYLAMELLEGETLAARLKRRGKLPPEEVLPIALQVGEALVAIHAAGVVHRDIKPANLAIVPSGEGAEAEAAREGDGAAPSEIVKVFDFGIARVEWEEMRITNTGVPLGTAGYMAPEQETGGEVDARSDVFALGAVVYECLVGEPPPSLTHGEPLSLAELPSAWREAVGAALASRPTDRFPDARAFVAAVRSIRP